AACVSGRCCGSTRWWYATPCTSACGCCGANRERRDAHAATESGPGSGVMPLHHALAWLAVAALPLLAGVAAAIGAAYRKVPAIGVLLSALAVMGLVFAIIVPVAYRCSAS